MLDTGQRCEGRDAIRATRASRPPRLMRHVCSNVVIDVIDERHARGRCYLTAYVEAGDATELGLPAVVGEYQDEFVRSEDGWQFASRVFKAALTRPTGQ